MRQDAPHDPGIVDGRDDAHPAAAVRTRQHVDAKTRWSSSAQRQRGGRVAAGGGSVGDGMAVAGPGVGVTGALEFCAAVAARRQGASIS